MARTSVMFVDSNIWCYYFNEELPEHHAVASFLEEQFEGSILAINVVVLIEAAHYLIKHLGPLDGGKKVDSFLSAPLIIHDLDIASTKTAIEWLRRYSHVGIGGRDATIIATMKKHGITQLVTHNQAFKKINDLTVIDPIDK